MPRFQPERLLIVLDLDQEVLDFDVQTLQAHGDGEARMRIDVLKYALRLFVQTKSRMNPRHEYAFLSFGERLEVLQDFSASVESAIDTINNLEARDESLAECDFLRLCEELAVFKGREDTIESGFVYRVVYVYTRSKIVPHIRDGKAVDSFLNQQDLFFDVFFLYSSKEKERSEANAGPVAVWGWFKDTLQDKRKGNLCSYLNNATDKEQFVYRSFATLLANAVQRPPEQGDFVTFR